MLCRLFAASGDYEKTLRLRRWMAAGLTAIGLLGIACYLLLVRDSAMQDYARGFYLGASCGLTLAGVVLSIRVWRLLRDPQAMKQAKIRETDERERHIANQSLQFAGMFTLYACAAALFVLAPISMAACQLLVAVMAVYMAAFLAANLWLSKKA